MKTLIFAFFVCLAIQSPATIHPVMVTNNSFSPSFFTAHPGDTIMWVWAEGMHTTTSTNIPPDAIAWSSHITSSSTSYMYVPTAPGIYNYACAIQPKDGMTGIFTVVITTGVNQENDTNFMKVYPNPVSSSLHLQFNSEGSLPVYVTITDKDGNVVTSTKYRTMRDRDIDVRDIPAGDYFFNAQQGDVAYSEQIRIVH